MAVHRAMPVWKEIGYRPRLAEIARSDSHRVVVAGAGPVGLTIALDLGQRGHDVVVVTALPWIAAGSKAICFSKRSLEIFDRLGVAGRLLDKGVVWETGKVFWKSDPSPVFSFDLLPVKDQKHPAFINIQQYYVEEYLLDLIGKHANIEVRWQHEVREIEQESDGVCIGIETPEGRYDLHAEWLIACDGNKSTVRDRLGLDFRGRAFAGTFLIADVRTSMPMPVERRFHFDPPYPGASSLIHRQPDDVWRLDFQLPPGVDRAEAVKPENVDPFVRGMLGADAEFDYVWLSVYVFQCRRMERFVHDRVVFAGDSAHLVSPFGARGCNGGLQDADNLVWKLDRVLSGRSPARLIDSYDEEACIVADENIRQSSRATDFMTPSSTASRMLRDAVLELAADFPFARPFVNSGRLSQAVAYSGSSRNGEGALAVAPGAVAIDAPVVSRNGDDWLLSHLGPDFTLLFPAGGLAPSLPRRIAKQAKVLLVAPDGVPEEGLLVDRKGLVAERYGAKPGNIYLVRPDQHVAASWPAWDEAKIVRALGRACADGEEAGCA